MAGTMRNVFAEAERGRDFLHVVEPGEFADAHAHRVARMNQPVGNRLDAAVSFRRNFPGDQLPAP